MTRERERERVPAYVSHNILSVSQVLHIAGKKVNLVTATAYYFSRLFTYKELAFQSTSQHVPEHLTRAKGYNFS